MKKKYIALIFLLFFLAINTGSYACSMMGPSVWLQNITDDKVCGAFVSHLERENNETYSEDSRIRMCEHIPLMKWRTPEYEVVDYFDVLNLEENDKTIILELFEGLEDYKLYRFIVEQTPEEYENFRNEAEKINSDMCDCIEYNIANRIGNWTSYERTFKDTCDLSPACYTPPVPCPGSIPFMGESTTNFIINLGLIGAVIIGFIVYIFYTRKKE